MSEKGFQCTACCGEQYLKQYELYSELPQPDCKKDVQLGEKNVEENYIHQELIELDKPNK